VLQFNCPACQHYGEADHALAGEIIGCGNCFTHFRLPELRESAPDAPKEGPRLSVKEPGKGAIVQAWARCTLCGARRTDHARCTFCGYEFRSADQVEIDLTRRYRRQVGMQFAAILSLAGALVGLPLLAFHWKTSNDDDKRLCQENLLIFHQALMIAQDKPAGLPQETGRAFLIGIAQKEGVNHALMCPAVSRGDTLRAVDYRGPARPWAELGPEDPVMVDLQGNHRGVMVLFKNGQIEYAPKDSPLYRRGLDATQD
jgi:hypothetical protein